MRVCLLTYEFPHSIDEAVVSGEVKNSYYLARGLREDGHDVTVVSVPFLTRSVSRSRRRRDTTAGRARGADDLERTDSFRVFDVPEGRLRGAARYAWRIANVARFLRVAARDPWMAKCDVIHAEAPALAAAALLARRAGWLPRSTPLVVSAHGTNLPEAGATPVASAVQGAARRCSDAAVHRIDRLAFRGATAVVAASRFQVNEMVETYGVPPSRLSVVHNGVDLRRYCPDGPRADSLPLEPEDPVVLFVGRLVPKKGLHLLIDAFSAIAAAVPRARCLVVGGSSVFDTAGSRLRRMAERTGVADRYVWLRDVPERDLPSIYRRAAVVAVPSVGYESLPTVVLEAVACGVPVVATRRWGVAEALGEDHPGLIEEGDVAGLARAVVALLANDQTREVVAARQAARLAAFGLDACVARHLEVYRRATG